MLFVIASSVYKSAHSLMVATFTAKQITAAVVLLLVIFVGYSTLELTKPASQSNSLVRVSIEQGASAIQIINMLTDKELVSHKFVLLVWLTLSGRRNNIVPGTYYLPANTNLVSLSRMISGGVIPANEVEVRIGEGWTLKQIVGAIIKINPSEGKKLQAQLSDKRAIQAMFRDRSELLFAGAISTNSFEGYIFPDTYRLSVDSLADTLVAKALDNFAKKFSPELVELAKAAKLSVHEVVTLASIVELEVPDDVDRKKVADLFLRRLKVGMKLEADSTVNYATGKSLASVTFADLKVDSPYNTYMRKGLPPGPIGSPSLSAILAVLYPTPNQAWFFLTTPSGEVIYSNSYADHLKAKQRYLR